MSYKRATSLNPPNNFWILLRTLPTSSAKLRILTMAEGIGSRLFVSSFHTCTISKPISYSLCKTLLFGICNARNLCPFSENPNLFSQRGMSSSSNQQQSFTVSYLIKSLGFCPESALSVSKNVNFESPEKADKVINLFKSYGFTQPQISSLVRATPRVLVSDSEKTLLPKLEFFKAKGISSLEMAKMLSIFPRLLEYSLAKQIIPSYDFLRNLFQSDERLTTAVKRRPALLRYNIEKHLKPRIDILREQGVPDSNIATLIMYFTLLRKKTDQLRETVEKVKEMGFKASKVSFVIAVQAFQQMSKSTWQSKVDAYNKCGWSQEDVLNAFHRCPWCMMLSEEKIMVGMDFYINKMGSRPSRIADHPKLLLLSLKKRLIPRFSVFQLLLSKGLVKKEVSLTAIFDSTERKFLQKFVIPYEKEAPEVLKLYKEKLNLSKGPLIDNI